MGRPWNNWCHCTAGTYGSWLYGDPRGFRTWRHREHVEGDYKKPPPTEVYAELYERTRASMPREAVTLTPAERELVADAVVEKLREWEVEFVNLAVAATHLHLLIRFRPLEGQQSRGMAIPRLSEQSMLKDGRDPLPRHVMGLLKKHAAHRHRAAGLSRHPGGLWARRGKVIPVNNRGHQVAVGRYIARHAAEGAAVQWGVERKQEGG
jgi:REP element-mobilizing transposase RayT